MRKVLYLGTHLPSEPCQDALVHLPIIHTVPRKIPESIVADFSEYSHLIFTSPNAVAHFFDQASALHWKFIAVGKSTAQALSKRNLSADFIATDESQEGVVALLKMLDLDDAYLLLPRSSKARGVLDHFLRLRAIRHQIFHLYDTKTLIPKKLPDLSQFDAVFFTSPSTVEAFVQVFGQMPSHINVLWRGPVTKEALLRWNLVSG